jgi:hypothetical protein
MLDGGVGGVNQVFDKTNVYIQLLATSTSRLATCLVLYQPYLSCRLMYATRMAVLLPLAFDPLLLLHGFSSPANNT